MELTNLPTDPALLSAHELSMLYKTRKLSPVEALAAIEHRIDDLNPTVNAYVSRNSDLLVAARESEARWFSQRQRSAIDGIPCSIKDSLDLLGFPTRAGSCLTSKEQATSDSPVAISLKQAGALMLGKTATTEFGWKAIGDSPQGGVTRNPWDLSRTPGGSSSGAGAAAAACLGPLHVGTDAGGSVRVPAAWCGLVGLKPTYGRIPQWPIGGFAHVSSAGPMTRDVHDTAMLLDAISRSDARDPYCLRDDTQIFDSEVDKDVKGLRIAIVDPGSFEQPIKPSDEQSILRATQILREAGAVVEPIDFKFPDLQDAFDMQWGFSLARIVRQFPLEKWHAFDPAMVRFALSHEGTTAIQHLEFEIEGVHFARRMDELHREFDLVMCPTVLGAPPRADTTLNDPLDSRWTRWGSMTFLFNVSRQPAISVPVGLDSMGLPLSVQLVAARYRDDLVLRGARAIERECRLTYPSMCFQKLD